MKNYLATAALVLIAGLGLAQQLAEESFVINIEVPVRVFQGDRFVENLTIDDFEILEDGKPQKLEAVYFIRRNSVERRDEVRRFVPHTNRNFYLFFEISNYRANLGEALDSFIHNVFMPGDNLTVVTPMKTYRMKPRALEARTRAEIAAQVKGLLRQDASIGSSEYNRIIIDLEDLARGIVFAISKLLNVQDDKLVDQQSVLTFRDVPVDDLLTRYTQTLDRLESLRQAEESRLTTFAQALKNDDGQKSVYLFYEREFVPRIDPKTLIRYMSLVQDRPDILEKFNDIFEFYRADSPFNIPRLKEIYADASIAINFLYLTPPPRQSPDIQFQERSDDMFNVFSQMARATGGYVESSENPVALMKNAVTTTERYYLLYYTPRPYVKDKKFHAITVRVKAKDVRLAYRIGYYAD